MKLRIHKTVLECYSNQGPRWLLFMKEKKCKNLATLPLYRPDDRTSKKYSRSGSNYKKNLTSLIKVFVDFLWHSLKKHVKLISFQNVLRGSLLGQCSKVMIAVMKWTIVRQSAVLSLCGKITECRTKLKHRTPGNSWFRTGTKNEELYRGKDKGTVRC